MLIVVCTQEWLRQLCFARCGWDERRRSDVNPFPSLAQTRSLAREGGRDAGGAAATRIAMARRVRPAGRGALPRSIEVQVVIVWRISEMDDDGKSQKSERIWDLAPGSTESTVAVYIVFVTEKMSCPPLSRRCECVVKGRKWTHPQTWGRVQEPRRQRRS